MKKILLAAIALAMVAQTLTAQTWLKTRAMTNDWQCIASSADGKKLIAGSQSGYLYVSHDSGMTWAQTALSNLYWNAVASSADGSKLVAAGSGNGNNPGGVFTSTNSGFSWVSTSLPSTNEWWGSIASSSDGNTLAATVLQESDFNNVMFLSTNSGVTWTSNQMSNAIGVAMSADGTKIFVVAPMKFWRLTDSGTTWIQLTNAPVVWDYVSPSEYIASSADGNRLVTCARNFINYAPGFIYVSTNSGNTWSTTSATSNNWNFVASSADGKILTAVADYEKNDNIYVSTNWGTTWTTNNSPLLEWSAVASSADGGNLFAAAANGSIYVARSVQRPMVNIAPTNGQLMLSWTVPSSGFTLQHSSDFHNWVNVTNKPVANNLYEQVILSETNGIGYYRLKTP